MEKGLSYRDAALGRAPPISVASDGNLVDCLEYLEAPLTDEENRITTLRRLRHHHIVKYVGAMKLANPGDFQSIPRSSFLAWPAAPYTLSQFLAGIDTVATAVHHSALPASQTTDLVQDSPLRDAISILQTIVYPSKSEKIETIDATLKAAVRRVFASFGCLAEALLYIHQRGISHGDISSANILIYPNEVSYKVTELNPETETVRDGLRLTSFSHLSMGKPGEENDILSLGGVFREMLRLADIYPNPSGLPDACESVEHADSSGSLVIRSIIQDMTANKPSARPSAGMVVLRLSAANMPRAESTYSLYGKCCTIFPLNRSEFKTLGPKPEDSTDSGTVNLNAVEPDLVDDGGSSYIIKLNREDKRIDPATIEYDTQSFNRVKALNLCHFYHLRGMCHKQPCNFRHDPIPPEDLKILRSLKRRSPCQSETRCRDPECFWGHNCPNMRPGTVEADRTKRSACHFGEKCYFSEDAHDVDLEVAFLVQSK